MSSGIKRRIWDLQKNVREAPERIGRRWRLATAPARCMPDFIIIGVMKGGTTTLMRTLATHPGVMATARGDLEYWSYIIRRRDLNWYRSHFPTRREAQRLSRRLGQPVAVGESSHDYLPHQDALPRILMHLPDVKAIAVLRNPIDRAYSHYQHAARKTDGREPLSFEEGLDMEEERMYGDSYWLSFQGPGATYEDGSPLPNFRTYGYKYLGRYVELLRPWVEQFPAERLLVIRSEDLFQEPARTFREVTAFIGVGDWQPAQFEAMNQGDYEPMASATRARLSAYFKPHNEALADLLGWDFGWD